MQFSQIATLFLAVATGINAMPKFNSTHMEPFELHARSCGAGLLKGKALKACQGACKIACNVIPNPVGSAACAASCNRKRAEPVTEAEIAAAEVERRDILEDRACGIFKGKAKELCQKGCSGTCVSLSLPFPAFLSSVRLGLLANAPSSPSSPTPSPRAPARPLASAPASSRPATPSPLLSPAARSAAAPALSLATRPSSL